MDTLGNLLSKRIRQTGLSKQVSTAMILEEFEKIVTQEFSAEIAKKIRPLYIKNNILNVACVSSVISQELNFKKPEILGMIAAKTGGKLIKDIRIISG